MPTSAELKSRLYVLMQSAGVCIGVLAASVAIIIVAGKIHDFIARAAENVR